MARVRKEEHQVDLHPDAWARFERAVNVVAKSPPQHRVKPKSRRKKRAARLKKGAPSLVR
jgi:hypothetical protein